MSRGLRWGCGIGCGAFALVCVAIAIFAYHFVSPTLKQVKALGASNQELIETFGGVEQHAAPLEIDAETVERFLAVRAACATTREELDQRLRDVVPSARSDSGALSKVVSVVGELGEALQLMSVYIVDRNKQLIQAEMSPWQYLYYYHLIYHVWLNHPLNDGPMVEEDGERTRLLDEDEGTYSSAKVAYRIKRYLGVLVANRADQLDPEHPDYELWQSESHAMTKGLKELAWRVSMPERWAEVLEPYRLDLEESYKANTNIFEPGPFEDESSPGLSIKID